MGFYTSDQSTIRITAHRGDSAHEHENTLAAFVRAISSGADAIELDLRRTSDHVIVVHHDAAIRPFGKAITTMSLAEAQAQALEAGFELPAFEEVCQVCRSRIVLDIELKEPGYEESVFEIATTNLGQGQFVFRSFKDRSVRRLKEIDRRCEAGLIVGSRMGRAVGGIRSFVPLTRRLTRCHADFISPHWKVVRPGFMRRMGEINCPVVPWTVDSVTRARRLAHLSVAGIVTNDPAKVREAMK